MASNSTKDLKTPQKKATLSMWGMAILMVTTVLSLRGLSSQAEFGYTSIFWYILAAILFLVPFSLVCAELASTYTNSGGLFRWCSEAFGPRWGWAAMYMDWVMVLIWFPAVLMFAAVALAYIFWPVSFDQTLAANKWYTLAIVLGVFWCATFVTFKGTKFANKLSTLGGLFGTIIPGAILIILGIIYVCTGGHNNIDSHQSFWPDFEKYQTIVLAASIFLFYAGMEIQAVKVNEMPNPAKTFPKSVFFAVIIILIIFIAGTLAIGFVEPAKDINLLASLLIAYNDLWAHLHCEWLGNIMAVFITFGVLGQVSAIISGPSTGILAVGKSGYLPKALQKTNKHGIQVPLLWIQGIWVSVLALVLIILPSVESAYQILSQLSTILYLVMVVIIYAAFVRLRRTEPNVKRGFKIPGGNFVKWLIGIVGIAGAIAAAIISFFPPSQINTGSPVVYIVILVVCTIVFLAIPFLIYDYRKPSWRDKNTDFFPFNWEIEGRQPGMVSKWPVGYEPTQEEIQRAMEWQDGDFGPVTMKTIGDITNMALRPNLSNGMPAIDLEKMPAVDILKDHEVKTTLAAQQALILAQKARELADTATQEADDVQKLAQGLAALVDAETKAHAATAAATAKLVKKVQDTLDPNEPFTAKDIEVHEDDNGAPISSDNDNK
ncbi:MAG: amino acid permease [Muribaculaceae bacterium]|nr:amino acid permease [Muribaculaceae bacterium]